MGRPDALTAENRTRDKRNPATKLSDGYAAPHIPTPA
jgi:hypothetical protein